MSSKYDCLKLENQLCFPLYACSRAVTRQYKPVLDKLDLTYTQYITMMVLWDRKSINVKELGKALFLDSGTLTPLIKKLESKGLITKKRSAEDERTVIIDITKEGEALRDKALSVPGEVGKCLNLSEEDAATLYRILYKILGTLDAIELE